MPLLQLLGGVSSPTWRGEKRPSESFKEKSSIAHALVEGDIEESITLVDRVLVYLKPKFGLNIPFVEKALRIESDSASSLSNDDYALWLALSVVSVCD